MDVKLAEMRQRIDQYISERCMQIYSQMQQPSPMHQPVPQTYEDYLKAIGCDKDGNPVDMPSNIKGQMIGESPVDTREREERELKEKIRKDREELRRMLGL